jgi:hypothetical protein
MLGNLNLSAKRISFFRYLLAVRDGISKLILMEYSHLCKNILKGGKKFYYDKYKLLIHDQ